MPVTIHVLIACLAFYVSFASASTEERPTVRTETAGRLRPGHPERPHIVFVTGDEEYRSEESMQFLAKLLEKHHGFRCTVCYAVGPDGTINPEHRTNIGGLEALKTADLMVVFLRYRQLPDEQLKLILEFANSGKPMVGFRTSTHAFQYDKGPNVKWNDAFGRDFFGQKWVTHHGHEKGEFLTAVKPIEPRKNHPILRGVTDFKVPSWLYHVEGGGDKLNGDCTTLLEGTSLVSGREKAGKTDRFPLTQPVAWTKSYTGSSGKAARVFFTTLGHPHDFKADAFRRVVINGVFWTLRMEDRIPADGCTGELLGLFDLSNAAFGGHKKGVRPPGP